ncbi:hypothetical protein IJV79_00045 [bacterium]|nr:hypothetical protein [bacterium]
MVNSVNSYSQAPQYENKFSVGKTVSAGVAGAALFKVANDALLRKDASRTMSLLRGVGADEFITSSNISHSAVKKAVNEAQKVLKSTDYINTIKQSVKSPKETATKVVETATETIKGSKLSDIGKHLLNKAKAVGTKLVSTAKSLKGETFKETISKVMKASKTVKGKQVVTLALGAVCGLMLFGTSQKKEVQQAS